MVQLAVLPADALHLAAAGRAALQGFSLPRYSAAERLPRGDPPISSPSGMGRAAY